MNKLILALGAVLSLIAAVISGEQSCMTAAIVLGWIGAAVNFK